MASLDFASSFAVLAEPVEARACGLIWRRACAQGGSRVVAPAGDSLSFASPKESKQRKGDPQSATPSRCEGANLRRVGCGVRRGTRFALRAPLGQPRRVRARSMGASTPMLTPQPPRRRRSQQGVGQPNSPTGHCFARPHLAGASATRCAGRAERSKGPNGCPPPGFPSGCAEERSGQRIRARYCLSAVKRSEFERDPAGREHRRLPAAKRRDAACRVAFSLVTFFWRSKRKPLRSRAHTPASALRKSTQITIKTIANKAIPTRGRAPKNQKKEAQP